MTKFRRRSQRGFNLVEVLIALAILGSVLLSIITLFFLGRTNVYSGRQMTAATSVAVHANEDMQAIQPRDIFKDFGPIITTTTVGANTVAGVNYPNSIIFTTAQAGTAADVGGYLQRWANLLPANRILNGQLTLILMPLDQTTANDYTTSQMIQIRIVVTWSEGTRNRSVFVDSTKMNRS